MKQEKPHRCVHCGHRPKLCTGYGAYRFYYYHCDDHGQGSAGETIQEAVKRWNLSKRDIDYEYDRAEDRVEWWKKELRHAQSELKFTKAWMNSLIAEMQEAKP